MSMNQKEELRTQNMIRFIEAARELIDQEGLESLSIRKIAEKAGFHNSTIYLYFRDMDHLVMLATLKHFTDYSRSLARLSRQNLPPLDNFFCDMVLLRTHGFPKSPYFLQLFLRKTQ